MKHLITTCSILLLFASCEKNELKEPVEVNVKMGMSKSTEVQDLTINSGEITLASFKIEGVRQEGAPVDLNKDFPEGLTIDFNSNEAIDELFTNLPQGNYTNLDISFTTLQDGNEPNLKIQGKYGSPPGPPEIIKFRLKSAKTFHFDVEPEDGNSIIILDKNMPSTLNIEFKPLYWFDIISDNMWNNANVSNSQGQSSIEIDKSNNQMIYDLVIGRIGEQSQATIGN